MYDATGVTHRGDRVPLLASAPYNEAAMVARDFVRDPARGKWAKAEIRDASTGELIATYTQQNDDPEPSVPMKPYRVLVIVSFTMVAPDPQEAARSAEFQVTGSGFDLDPEMPPVVIETAGPAVPGGNATEAGG